MYPQESSPSVYIIQVVHAKKNTFSLHMCSLDCRNTTRNPVPIILCIPSLFITNTNRSCGQLPRSTQSPCGWLHLRSYHMDLFLPQCHHNNIIMDLEIICPQFQPLLKFMLTFRLPRCSFHQNKQNRHTANTFQYT